MFALVANRDSRDVSVYSINTATGALTEQGTVSIGSGDGGPVAIAFNGELN